MAGLRAVQSAIQRFLQLESAGGILLVGAAVLATLLMNSPLAGGYAAFLQVPVTMQFGELGVAKPLLPWINDGLIAIFFFLVGLELKRELLEGELSTRSQVVLPAAAAIGGMAVPAIVYVLFNQTSVRVGVIVGSLVSALVGYLFLRFVAPAADAKSSSARKA